MFDQSLSSFSSGCSCVIDAPLPRNVNVFKTRLLISGNIWKYLFLLCSALATYWRISLVWAQSILEPGLSMRIVWRPPCWLHSFHLLRLQTITALPSSSSSSPPHRISLADWLFLHLHTASTLELEAKVHTKFRNQGECPYLPNFAYYHGVNIHLA